MDGLDVEARADGVADLESSLHADPLRCVRGNVLDVLDSHGDSGGNRYHRSRTGDRSLDPGRCEVPGAAGALGGVDRAGRQRRRELVGDADEHTAGKREGCEGNDRGEQQENCFHGNPFGRPVSYLHLCGSIYTRQHPQKMSLCSHNGGWSAVSRMRTSSRLP